MNILFLTDNFPPEGNAPATRTFEHAVRWVESGHHVTIITCAPNFPEGKVFEGYKNRWYQIEMMNGIRVVRVKTYITANEGFAKRILDYISFMISSFFAGLFQKNVDIVVATSPQFFCAVSGWGLSVVRRKPFIFELRDIWPASITAVGAMRDNLAINLLEKLELFLYRRATAIIPVTHSFKKELIARGIPAEKIEVVLNGVDLSKYKRTPFKDPDLARKYGLENKFVAAYIGTHGLAHGLENIVSVANSLKEHDDIRILFVGGGAAKQKVKELVISQSLDNVILIDRQPKEMMPRIWSLCDVSLVPLVNQEVFRSVIPSKIFECMGMGIPTILSLPEGEATNIVREDESGLVVECENVNDIAEAIYTLYSSPSKLIELKNNSVDAAPKFGREIMAKKMVTIFERYTL